MLKTKPIDYLRESFPFRNVSDHHLQSLATRGHTRTYQTGVQLFEEGQSANAFYIVMSGEVHLYRWSPEGEAKVFQVLVPGDMVAEAAMFMRPAKYPMNARIEKKSKLYSIARGDLLALCEQSNELLMELLSAMSNKLNYVMNRIDQLTMKNAGQRLVSYLLDLHQQQHTNWLDLPVSYGILASQLAITPETLSRLLQKFRQKGVISGKRKTLVLLDIDGMCDLVELPRQRLCGFDGSESTDAFDPNLVGCCNLS